MWRKRSRPGRHQADIQQAIFSVEALETRTLLSVSINAGTVVSSVPTDFEGINTAPWDNALSPLSTNGSQTLSLSEAAGINGVRLGGGSYVDGSSSVVSGKTVITTGWHFNVNNQSTTIGQMAEYAADLGANAIVDVNYGTGSPEEAVALWAYLNGNPNDTTSIASLFGNNAGDSEQWSTSSQTWVSENWQTVGYWASLRAATPLATDDGLNFLRLNGNGTTTINHPAAFNFTNWEIGNEVYGSWEIDEHGVATDTLPMPIENGTQTKAKAHDPTTIISFAKQFQTAINAILADGMESSASPISIGIDSQAVDSSSNNWITKILQQSVTQGFTLGYIADHYYTSVSPGSENDATLLGTPNTSASGNTYDISQRINDYDSLISTYDPGQNVKLFIDEFNSVSSSPGKESVSIVNGLFVADAFGAALNTTGSNGLGGAQGIWVWDLHNGPPSPNGNTSSSLYGWRTEGDYGILGNGSTYSVNELSPDYMALELVSKFAQTGGTVVSSTLDSTNKIDSYAILEPNGDLDLLVINKNPPGGTPPTNTPPPTISETFNISGFTPSGAVSIWQYGVAEDDAQDLSSTKAASLTNINTNLSVSSNSFTYNVPDYTMMVFQLAPQTGPTVVQAAAANPSPVTGTTTTLSALGSENGSGAGLNYTWSATSVPPGVSAPTYSSSNGTNSGSSTVATFFGAGHYTFLVTITDASNISTTSSVNVTVNQTPSSIAVTPSNITVATGAQQQFSATATDQFGNAISSPTFTWSITGSGNSIDGTGLATLGSTTGGYTVTAMSGSASNTASVTVATVPVVSTFEVNDGNVQRAMVNSLTLTFNEPVTLSPGAITLNLLSQTGGASMPITNFNPNSPDGGMTWVLTFTDPSYVGGSLPDGAYEVSVLSSGVSAAGLNMDANQNFTFWRLYGDFEGTGTVNGDDFTTLVGLLGTQTTSSDWYVDYDAAGVIGGDAFTALVSRLGKSISIPSLPSVVVLAAAAPVTTLTTTTTPTPKKATVVSPPPAITPVAKPVSRPKPRHGHR